MVFVHLVERRVLSPLKWPRGELRAKLFNYVLQETKFSLFFFVQLVLNLKQ